MLSCLIVKTIVTRKLSYRKDDRANGAMRPMYGCPETGVSDYAHGNFSRNFYWAFVPSEPINVHAKLEVRSLTRSWDNSNTALCTIVHRAVKMLHKILDQE